MMLIPHHHPLQKGPLDLIDTGKGLKVQTDKPHLVSLGSGRLSTAVTLLPLEEGELWTKERTSGLPTCLPAPILLGIPARTSGSCCCLPATLRVGVGGFLPPL